MAIDFNKYLRPELEEFLKKRLFGSLHRYKKPGLVNICKFVQEMEISPEPSMAERTAEKKARIEEVLTISPKFKLPHPDSKKLLWSAAISDFPEMNLLQLYNYYILGSSPAYPAEKLKAYKSMGSYRNAVDGFVAEICVCKDEQLKGWIFVKGKVFASQRIGVKYDVWAMISEKGDIRFCNCQCADGLGEVCSHSATLLFYVLIINENRWNQYSVTEKPNAWLPPPKEKGDSCLIKDCLKRKNEVEEKLTWLKIPKTTTKQTALLDSIAPGSSLSMTRKAHKRKPPPQIVIPSQDSFDRHLPPLIIEVASAFLIKTGETADIDSALLMADIRGSVSAETASTLEDLTRSQSDGESFVPLRRI